MSRILIATEGSTCSAEAVRRLASLFDLGSTELHILSVVPHAPLADQHPQAAQIYHHSAEDALAALDETVAELAGFGLKAHSVVKVGDPAELIVRVAGHLQADLIVMGSHRRRGMERLLRGSVAEEVLHLAPCAVMIHPHVDRAEVQTAEIF